MRKSKAFHRLLILLRLVEKKQCYSAFEGFREMAVTISRGEHKDRRQTHGEATNGSVVSD